MSKIIGPSRLGAAFVEYDGWPNGLKIHRDGRIFVTDFKRGIVVIDPETRKVEPSNISRRRTTSSSPATATCISPIKV